MTQKDSGINHLIAGALSGAFATSVTAPLELVKTILQNSAEQGHLSTVSVLKNQLQNGGIRACFRGLSPSLIAIVPHHGLYFTSYSQLRSVAEAHELSQTSATIFASMGAGILANIVTNPLWVVKSKMSSSPTEYSRVWSSLVKITHHEGARGLCSGMGPSIFGVSHVMLQFPAYELIKKKIRSNNSDDFISTAVASMASKFVASVPTYPFDLVRTRLQTSNRGNFQCLKVINEIKKSQGLRGFYRGFSVSMLKSVPSTVLTMCLYEAITMGLENYEPSDFYESSNDLNLTFADIY